MHQEQQKGQMAKLKKIIEDIKFKQQQNTPSPKLILEVQVGLENTGKDSWQVWAGARSWDPKIDDVKFQALQEGNNKDKRF